MARRVGSRRRHRNRGKPLTVSLDIECQSASSVDVVPIIVLNNVPDKPLRGVSRFVAMWDDRNFF